MPPKDNQPDLTEQRLSNLEQRQLADEQQFKKIIEQQKRRYLVQCVLLGAMIFFGSGYKISEEQQDRLVNGVISIVVGIGALAAAEAKPREDT